MDFSDIVKRVRETLDMSQEELAHALNVSFVSINRWENGKTKPNKLTQSVFFAFCEQRGIDAKKMLQDNGQEE